MYSPLLRNGCKAAVALFLMASLAAALPTGFNSKVLFTGLDLVSSEVLPDGRVLAVEKHGKIHILDQKTGTKSVALDYESKTNSAYEGGMCQVLADPNFSSNGYVYVQYAKRNAVGTTVHDWVSRFKMSNNTIDAASEFKIADLGAFGPNYHHGCGLAVSPKDGHLYIGSGSRYGGGYNARGAEAAQANDEIEGKILRVKIPDGTAPADNPFPNNTGDLKLVYYKGVRNPFTMAFHPTTGVLWFQDVQPGAGDDEANAGGASGANYGYGGSGTGPLWKASGVGGCAGGAQVGALWYTGNNFPASYKDKFFFGQVRNCGSNLKYTDASHSSYTSFGPFNTGNGNYSPIDVKMDLGGAIYVSTRYQTENVRATNGQVIKVWYGDTEPPIPTSTLDRKARDVAFNQMNWKMLASGSLSVELVREGAQTVSLRTLDGRTIAERKVSGKGFIELPAAGAKGLHVLHWTDGELTGAAKVLF